MEMHFIMAGKQAKILSDQQTRRLLQSPIISMSRDIFDIRKFH